MILKDILDKIHSKFKMAAYIILAENIFLSFFDFFLRLDSWLFLWLYFCDSRLAAHSHLVMCENQLKQASRKETLKDWQIIKAQKGNEKLHSQLKFKHQRLLTDYGCWLTRAKLFAKKVHDDCSYYYYSYYYILAMALNCLVAYLGANTVGLMQNDIVLPTRRCRPNKVQSSYCLRKMGSVITHKCKDIYVWKNWR
jgi:hypothetical protein